MKRAVAVCIAVCALGCTGRTNSNDPPAVAREAAPSVRWVTARAARDVPPWEAPAVARVDGLGHGDVTATVRVRIVRVSAQPGDHVTAGQVLAEAEAPDVVRALAGRDASAGRLPPLRAWRTELRAQRDAGLVRAGELREVEARLADAEAEQRRADADVRASGFTAGDLATLQRTGRVPLRAPVAGVVRSVAMVPGHVAEPGGPPLAEVSGERPARIEVRLQRAWPDGASLRFEPLSGAAVALDATPMSEVIDPETGARVLWLRPLSPVNLPAGTAGRVVVSGLASDAVEVPARALLRVGSAARVLLREGDRPTPRDVTVLSTTPYAAVITGIAAGAEVAAEADQVAPSGEAR